MSLLFKEVRRKFLWGTVICYFRFGETSSIEDDRLHLTKLKVESIQHFRHAGIFSQGGLSINQQWTKGPSTDQPLHLHTGKAW